MVYVPERGDIVWLDFDPVLGHEQGGHRPALVISPLAYNKTVGLMLCCPMTTKIKGYPLRLSLKVRQTVLHFLIKLLALIGKLEKSRIKEKPLRAN